jgi:hypothetical protein
MRDFFSREITHEKDKSAYVGCVARRVAERDPLRWQRFGDWLHRSHGRDDRRWRREHRQLHDDVVHDR